LTGWQLARVGDLAFVGEAGRCAVAKAHRRISVASGKVFNLDSERALFTLRYQHNGVPPDFELLMYGDTRQWFEVVATSLFGEFRRDLSLFDRLRAN
jgi:hypothetical protein